MEEIKLNTETIQILSAEQAWNYHIIPEKVNGEMISFMIDENHCHGYVKNELELLLGKKIVLNKAPSQLIRKALGHYYRKSEITEQKNTQVLKSYEADDLLIKLIEDAWRLKSSDIHLEIFEEKARIRFRIDGKLMEKYILNKVEYPALVNKIKIKSNLDIAEKRLPQDGRMLFDSYASKFDIRVSVLPSLYGEKVVLRLLSRESVNIDIHSLGFFQDQLDHYLEGIRKTSGIVLISGPTGSGKTTTLYATLKILNKTESNILTIEDPIEYTLEGINQVQMKEGIGLTFSRALRTFLRQDPDIIMLGEIRDKETAEMAIRAALTGHLVLSTIHTNSAWGTISRLTDMGIPAYLLADTMNLTVAQRLVRLLCNECKVNTSLMQEELSPVMRKKKLPESHYKAVGCEACHYTGYKGRKAIFEIIPVNDDLSELIKTGASDIKALLKKMNIKTLEENAVQLLADGETSLEEIYGILLMNL